jgi:sodium-dependent dicarboxylate transporter 2/3/5
LKKSKRFCLLLGPALFLTSFIPYGGFELKARIAIGTVLWMAAWWVTMPVKPAITAFLPVAVNALFSVVPMGGIISAYSAELVFLLAGRTSSA